eukprot:scaffold14289_cov132-Skeletonema_dohrnii-CCMP3373.AAC.9
MKKQLRSLPREEHREISVAAIIFVWLWLLVFVVLLGPFFAVGRALESACLVGNLRLVDHTNSYV